MKPKELKSLAIPLESQGVQLLQWPGSALANLKVMARTRGFNFMEITAVSVVYFWVVWRVAAVIPVHGLGVFPLMTILATVMYVAYISPAVIHQDSMSARGLGSSPFSLINKNNLLAALRWFGSFTLFGAACLLLAGFYRNPDLWLEVDGLTFLFRLMLYLFSALGQGAFFFSFFFWRWQAIFQPGNATPERGLNRTWRPVTEAVGWPVVVANASLFSLYHLPNGMLMILTLILGLAWGRIFSRIPNLLVAAAGHAVLGTILNVVLKVNIQVGSAYSTGHKSFYRALFPLLDTYIRERF